MFNASYSIYLGNEGELTHIDFVSGENFFMIVEMKNQIDKEELKALLNNIKETIEEKKTNSLKDLTTTIDAKISPWISGEKFSLSAALISNEIIYFMTRGKGEVFVVRGGKGSRLINGESTSSGYIQNNDFFVLTTPDFSLKTNGEKLAQVLTGRDPQAVLEYLTPDLKSNDDIGMIAMFIQCILLQEEKTEIYSEIEDDTDEAHQPQARNPKIFFQAFLTNTKSRKVTLIIVVILGIIFIWSVLLGNQRRVRKNYLIYVDQQEKLIDAKLLEADQIAGTNIREAISRVEQAQSLFDQILLEGDNKKINDVEKITVIKKKIDEKEKSIKKSESSKFEEFYDFSLIDQGVIADDVYLNGNDLVVLDKKSGKIHIISLEKKSVSTIQSSTSKDSSYIALYQDEPYLFSHNKGIVKISEEKKEETIIAKDDEWGLIKDFWIYNGNIYLLDIEKDEIYKYLVAENGYSNKTSYFKSGQSVDLSEARAMTIDAFVYIALGGKVLKYGSGERNEFTMDLPDQKLTFTSIFTSKSIDNVYLADSENGIVIVVDKDGVFKEQIAASKARESIDILVRENNEILIVTKAKIFKIIK